MTVGDLGQVCEEDRRYAAVLPRVSDHERDFRLMLIDAHIRGVGHQHRRIPGDDHQAEPVRVVDVERPSGRPLDARRAKEPKADRVGGQPLKERPHRRAVLHANRTHVDRRSIAQGNVRLSLARIPQLARRRLGHDRPLSIAWSETASAVATDSQRGIPPNARSARAAGPGVRSPSVGRIYPGGNMSQGSGWSAPRVAGCATTSVCAISRGRRWVLFKDGGCARSGRPGGRWLGRRRPLWPCTAPCRRRPGPPKRSAARCR